METRDEILHTMAEAYKKGKGRMLDHVVEVTANRAYASANCLTEKPGVCRTDIFAVYARTHN
jgi:hypothetical protein